MKIHSVERLCTVPKFGKMNSSHQNARVYLEDDEVKINTTRKKYTPRKI